jgi:hypothetical protein
MSGKYIAFSLIAVGLLLLLMAWRAESSASFDDGSFLDVIALAIGGVGLCIAGGLWLSVLMFIAL